MRGRSECLTASQAWSMSLGTARARDAMMGPLTSRAMLLTASKSPGELAANPASMNVHPHPLELSGDLHLFFAGHAYAGGLLPVAERWCPGKALCRQP